MDILVDLTPFGEKMVYLDGKGIAAVVAVLVRVDVLRDGDNRKRRSSLIWAVHGPALASGSSHPGTYDLALRTRRTVARDR